MSRLYEDGGVYTQKSGVGVGVGVYGWVRGWLKALLPVVGIVKEYESLGLTLFLMLFSLVSVC